MTIQENFFPKHGSLGPGNNVSCGRCFYEAEEAWGNDSYAVGYATACAAYEENTDAVDGQGY